jgi:hypothetical protein
VVVAMKKEKLNNFVVEEEREETQRQPGGTFV